MELKKAINIGLLIGIGALAIFFFFLDPARHNIFPRCIFNSVTGYYCPGCGSQRAVHDLLHLNFGGVISHNFLFLPAGLLLLYHYLHPAFNKWFNLKLPNLFYFKSTPWIILAVVVLFWILRNIPMYPFSVLAPG